MRGKIIIVGCGAAGMLAGVGALERNVEPIIIEKMPRPGTKLLITGKGRCNITNSAEDIELFVKNMPGNGVFLYSALYTFSNKDLLSFLEGLGIKTKTERGGRVFPVTDRASDVVNALYNFLKKNGADIKFRTSVQEIIVKDGEVCGVRTNEGVIPASTIIVTTGGASYPRTGSTGDGFKFAHDVGHTIIPPQPALVPLETYDKWVEEVQGLTLKNVEVTAYQNDKRIASEFGELLFTHYGVSGPIILTISRNVVHALNNSSEPVHLKINLKPALTQEKLDKRLQMDFEKYNRKLFKNSLKDLLPSKLIVPFIKISGISPDKPVNQITREERLKLVNILQNLPLTIKKPRPLSEAIVTSGGVSVKEIDPSTMESKIIKGLYFAGEILDVDGYTGGFNLQAAFSTGYLAGISAAEFINST